MDEDIRLRKRSGRTYNKPVPGSQDALIVEGYDASIAEPPIYKTRNALRDYLFYRNRRRFKKLEREFAWAKRELQRINCNPEDARFLL